MIDITHPENLEESIKLVNAYIQEELDVVAGRIRWGGGGFFPPHTPAIEKKLAKRKKEIKQQITESILDEL